MKTVFKSKINSCTFFYDKEVECNNKIIVRAWIDNKRAYFIETRNCINQLLESKTVYSLKELRGAL